MKKVISTMVAIILCVSLIFSLAACGGGPDEAKVNKVQSDYASLVSEHNAVAQSYESASAAGVQLNQDGVNSFNSAADFVNEFGEITLNDKTDADLDEYISDIAEYRSNLRTIASQLESLIAEQQQDEWEDAYKSGDAYEDDEYEYWEEDADLYFTGAVGDESSIYMVGFSVSADGTQCMFAFGNPGDALVVLGQLVDGEGGSGTIYPLDGNESIEVYSSPSGDGSLSFEVFGFEGSLEQVSSDEFMEVVDMLS